MNLFWFQVQHCCDDDDDDEDLRGPVPVLHPGCRFWDLWGSFGLLEVVQTETSSLSQSDAEEAHPLSDLAVQPHLSDAVSVCLVA